MTSFKAAYDSTVARLTAEPDSPFYLEERRIDGVAYSVLANAPRHIRELVEPARRYGDEEFLVYNEERWTFADFFNRVDQLAYQLLNYYGIGKGERVAIAMRNYPEWMVAWLAIVSIGAVAVPVNSWGSAEELEFNIADSEASLIICDQRRCDLIDYSATPVPMIVVRPDSDTLPATGIDLADLLADAPNAETLDLPPVEIEGEDTAMIMYTSGTSGRPKGAVFSHRSCCQAIVNLELAGAIAYMTNEAAFSRHQQLGLRGKNLLAVPLFHVSGLYSQFLLNLRGGRTLVLMYKWDPQVACELIEREKITNLLGAPTMLLDLLECERFDATDTSSLINIAGGGAASPRRLARVREQRLPGVLGGAGWGMTESGGIGSSFTGAPAHAKPDASGFVHPVVQLRFCDEDGNEVPAGTPGEMWLKSPTNVNGYWNRPDGNESEFRDGWFRTGDIGYLDEDGCMHICDRAKDMVIRGGENIYPIEVENCILSMPGVAAVTAFAVPSETMGEELAVVIRPDSAEALSEDIVKRQCAEHLAAFKVPSFVKFTDRPFPVNATNKVLKKEVRKAFFPGL